MAGFKASGNLLSSKERNLKAAETVMEKTAANAKFDPKVTKSDGPGGYPAATNKKLSQKSLLPPREKVRMRGIVSVTLTSIPSHTGRGGHGRCFEIVSKEFCMTTTDPTLKILVTTTDGVTTEHEYSYPSQSDEWDRLADQITKTLSRASTFVGLNNPMVGYNTTYIIRLRLEDPEMERRQVMGFLRDHA